MMFPKSRSVMKWFRSLGGEVIQNRKSRSRHVTRVRFPERLEDRNLMAADFTLLADINPGVGNSDPYGIVAVGSTAFFVAPKPGSTNELELWKSDGTTAGTSLVSDLPSDTFGSAPEDFTDVNGTLYFSALNPTVGNRDLWRSNGTAAGTTLVSAQIMPFFLSDSLPPRMAFIGDNLFFQGIDSAGDIELWRTVISTGVTSRVIDINTAGSSEPGSLTVFNGELYFSATDTATGRELWKTNPTTLATTRLSDFDGASSFDPNSFEVFGSHLYFAGTTIADGAELYRISSAANSTPTLVMNITPNVTTPTAAVGSSNPANLTAVNGTLLFSIFPTIDGSVAAVAPEIWKTDGTTTVRVFNGFSTSQFIYDLGRLPVIGNSAFMSVLDDTTGAFQAWKSDGTAVGTVQATELTAGTPAITDPQEIARVGALTYFVGSSATAGVEIFVTNQAPTDITISNSSIAENSPINTIVGALSTTDPNGFDSFAYTLVAGTGSDDNSLFSIAPGTNQLRVNGALNFETKPSLSIRVRTTDNSNKTFEKQLTISVTNVAEVAVITGRRVFYNNSIGFGTSGANNAPTVNPTAAIATDKVALLPGQAATTANFTNYTRGLNGIVIDIADASNLAGITAASFEFATWSVFPNATPNFVVITPAVTISTFATGGAGGVGRIKLVFGNNAIQDSWLRVRVLVNANTGLASPDVFYFGNARGDTAASSSTPFTTQVAVQGNDFNSARANQVLTVPIDNRFDADRSGAVNGADLNLIRARQGTFSLRAFTAPAARPANPSALMAPAINRTSRSVSDGDSDVSLF